MILAKIEPRLGIFSWSLLSGGIAGTAGEEFGTLISHVSIGTLGPVVRITCQRSLRDSFLAQNLSLQKGRKQGAVFT